MTSRRAVQYQTVDDALADVATLRRGYARHGAWSLPQICWHVGVMVERYVRPAAPGLEPTPEQAAAKARFIDPILAGTAPGAGVAAPELVAAPDAGDDAIALFDAQVRRLRDFPHAAADLGACGPVAIDEVRRCHLVHAAHHLSHLVPHRAGQEAVHA